MDLPSIFGRNLKIQGTDDECSLFSTFLKNLDEKDYLKWIDDVLSKGSHRKDKTRSIETKVLGNEVYKQKQFTKSIKLYSDSLGLAEYNSEEYGTALSNRSAAFYMLEDFLNCVSDIKLCLKSKYPEDKKLNLRLRAADCFYHLNKFEEYNEAIAMIKQLFPTHGEIIEDRICDIERKCRRKKTFFKTKLTIPYLKNDKFFGASTKIKLSFTEEKGRHVVASESISVGETLFVEKAFAFALVLDENTLPIKSKCSYCLGDTIATIPCKQCTYCFYCNEDCRDFSWKESHQFECFGIELFYKLGITFPAFRCLMKGIKSNFEVISEPKSNVNKFGTSEDNYKYFNSLSTNILKMDNVAFLLQTAAIIIIYLKEKTTFFDWLMVQSQIIEKSLNSLIIKMGATLVRHMAQLMCNSSTILHWNTFFPLNENLLLHEPHDDYSKIIDLYNSKAVACGIYPSISMMNHSCKPNITLYFLRDVVIAKAAENINIGEEIFNCYGIDYKSSKRHERKELLNNNYYFSCSCEICASEEKEYDRAFNYYICKNCKEKLKPAKTKLKCGKCKISFQENAYKDLEKNLQTLLLQELALDYLKSIIEKAKAFLGETHNLLYLCYERISEEYCNKGNEENSTIYQTKCLEILAKSHGQFSRKYILLENSLQESNNSINNIHLYYPIKEINILKYTCDI